MNDGPEDQLTEEDCQELQSVQQQEPSGSHSFSLQSPAQDAPHPAPPLLPRGESTGSEGLESFSFPFMAFPVARGPHPDSLSVGEPP